MKVITPNIAWNYEVEPINSIDFRPNTREIAVVGSDSSGEQTYMRVS